MELINLTRFTAERLQTLDRGGREILLVVVKATFDIQQGRVTPSEEQEPVRLADEYHGEPGKSSLRHAADSALLKPATDVLLQGNAYPRQKGDTQVDVSLRVGGLTKVVRVFGDRRWTKTLGMARMSKPEPLDRVPLVFERAFGGSDLSDPEKPEWCPSNPVGVGYRREGSKSDVDAMPLPNLEDRAQLLRSPSDRPEPACFAPVAPNWSPRVGFAGTYDEKWQADTMPLLPEDFDEQFHQVAPAQQVYPGFVIGGEAVEVTGATPEGRLLFSLPKVQPEVQIRIDDELIAPECKCDTVVIDAERRQLSMAWRATQGVHGRVEEVVWVKVGLHEGSHGR